MVDPGGARNPSPGPIFTARQRSCGKVMFSVMSICLSMGGPYVTITHNALDLTIYEPFSVYVTSNGSLPQPLLYTVQEPLAPVPPGMDELLQFGPRLQPPPRPPPIPDMPELGHNEAHMVGKWAVDILLECFFVFNFKQFSGKNGQNNRFAPPLLELLLREILDLPLLNISN